MDGLAGWLARVRRKKERRRGTRRKATIWCAPFSWWKRVKKMALIARVGIEPVSLSFFTSRSECDATYIVGVW